MHSEEGNKVTGLKACPMKSSKNLWGGLVWRKGGPGVTSLLHTASWGGDIKSEMLITSPWYQVIGYVEMVQICTRAGLDLTLGSFSLHWDRLPREVVKTLSLSFKRYLDYTLSKMLWLFCHPWSFQAVGTDDQCRSLPTKIAYAIPARTIPFFLLLLPVYFGVLIRMLLSPCQNKYCICILKNKILNNFLQRNIGSFDTTTCEMVP